MNNIIEVKNLISPENLKKMIPLTSTINNFVEKSRKTVQDIISGKDDRIIVIVGPCSIHDTNAAFEYSKQLVEFQKDFPNLFIVMRVYFEKPRTRTGWKGLINDPDLDNSLNIQKGLYLARELLVKINQIGLPTACEFLENNTPIYFSDLVSWGAIGARTVTSQIHRQLASGLSMPIGFKNFTDGNFNLAIDGILSSFKSHTYPGINENGENCLFVTKGNKFNHLILRGGIQPNYYPDDIKRVEKCLKKENIKNRIIIDCSHGNSGKDFNRQSIVCHNIANQIKHDNKIIAGVMIESFIKEGNQKITNNLDYGVSITDSCISLETTKLLLERLNESKNQSVLSSPNLLFENLQSIRGKLDDYKKNILDIIKGKSCQLKKLKNRYTYNSINLDLDYKIIPELIRLIKTFKVGTNEIDLIDLILDRIYLGMIVAEIKFKNDPFKYLKNNFDKYFNFIEDKKRENEILSNFLIPGVKDLFGEIIFDSKLIQLEYLKQRVKNIKIGYLGPKGTFSYEACSHFNKNISFIPCLSFDTLKNNFEENKLDYILLPIYNNITGTINVLKNENYKILGKVIHKINLAILSPNTNLENNKGNMIIYSHPQAYLEVKTKLDKIYPEHKFIETKSTFNACLKAISENQYSLASINNQSIFMNKINNEELEKDNITEFGLYKI